MNKLKIIFKSGKEITLELKKWSIKQNALGELCSIKLEGAENEIPVFINMSEIVYIGEVE